MLLWSLQKKLTLNQNTSVVTLRLCRKLLDFLGKLTKAIERWINDKDFQKFLTKTLALDNVNGYCHSILHPKKEDTMGYLYACRNARTYNYPFPLPNGTYDFLLPSVTVPVASAGLLFLPITAPLTIQAIQVQTPGNQISGLHQIKVPGLCLRCGKGVHWARDCHSVSQCLAGKWKGVQNQLLSSGQVL